jgi:geranylgeranyl pyrophosphate synthase
MDLEAYLAERRGWVDAFLRERIERAHDPLVAELLEAVAYSLEGGKRIRAILVMEAAGLAGESPKRVLPTAAAVECFHAYSLVHDDLPAMDDDAIRRGRPTVHICFGEATAILTGDSLIPLGFELISREQLAYSEPERVLQVVALFAQALGPQGLTGGQLLDLAGGDKEGLWPEIHRRKTAVLFEGSLAAGAILGGMDAQGVERLRAFGLKLGLAYQLVDDLLDWDKPEGASISRFMGREEAERLVEEQTKAALVALEPFGERAALLRSLTEYLGRRRI